MSVMEKHIFCRLVKVDVAKREVWGVVTGEKPDRTDEICDYETTVPYYKELVAEMSKATDGANIFPLRAMHGLIAAGKGIGIEFRDDTKEVYMGFKVVDDNEWKKVEEGVYTGFSQGGRYVKKWKDGDYTRYTAKPGEVSLVDLPCYGDAHFEYIKTDGSIEMRKLGKSGEIPNTPTPVGTVDPSATKNPEFDCKCGCKACNDGNCSQCTVGTAHQQKAAKPTNLEKKVKYLVEKDGENHLPYTDASGKLSRRLMRAAWSVLHDEGKYEGPDKAKAITKLKRLYAQESLETPAEKSDRIVPQLEEMVKTAINNRAYGMLGKGMYSVSRFSSIVDDLRWLWIDLEYERRNEEDESPATDDLAEHIQGLLETFLAYVEEEVEETKQQMKEFAAGKLL